MRPHAHQKNSTHWFLQHSISFTRTPMQFSSKHAMFCYWLCICVLCLKHFACKLKVVNLYLTPSSIVFVISYLQILVTVRVSSFTQLYTYSQFSCLVILSLGQGKGLVPRQCKYVMLSQFFYLFINIQQYSKIGQHLRPIVTKSYIMHFYVSICFSLLQLYLIC